MLLRLSNYSQRVLNFKLLPGKAANPFGKTFNNTGVSIMLSQESAYNQNVTMKPPNIFIFNNQESSSKQFEKITDKLSNCLIPNCYTIYQLKPSHIVNTSPWKENTILLINLSSNTTMEFQSAFQRYFDKGGSILSIASDLCLPGISMGISKESQSSTINYKNEVHEIDPSHSGPPILINHVPDENLTVLGDDSNENPIVVEILRKNCCAVLSQVDLGLLSDNDLGISILKDLLKTHYQMRVSEDDCSVPEISTVYFTTKTILEKKRLEEYIEQKERKLSLTHSTLLFQRTRKLSTSFGISMEYNVEMLPEKLSEMPELSFDLKKFFHFLNTRHLGTSVMYAETVKSTMDLIDGISNDFGMVAIARVQTTGKGRSGNKWLSPDGCAMFTFQLTIPFRSKLGQAISFVQHLTSLAIIHTVRQQPDYKDLELAIKWPNDVYFGTKSKLGGILVNSILYSDTIICYVGCGINLSNKHPTICINSIIDEYNREHETHLQKLTTEWFIASVLNCLEALIDDFQLYGPASCLPLYYQYWIHGGQELKLYQSDKTVIVEGLDEYGYLSVSYKEGDQTGKTLSLQPDGNSLDMMKNLLVLK